MKKKTMDKLNKNKEALPKINKQSYHWTNTDKQSFFANLKAHPIDMQTLLMTTIYFGEIPNKLQEFINKNFLEKNDFDIVLKFGWEASTYMMTQIPPKTQYHFDDIQLILTKILGSPKNKVTFKEVLNWKIMHGKQRIEYNKYLEDAFRIFIDIINEGIYKKEDFIVKSLDKLIEISKTTENDLVKMLNKQCPQEPSFYDAFASMIKTLPSQAILILFLMNPDFCEELIEKKIGLQKLSPDLVTEYFRHKIIYAKTPINLKTEFETINYLGLKLLTAEVCYTKAEIKYSIKELKTHYEKLGKEYGKLFNMEGFLHNYASELLLSFYYWQDIKQKGCFEEVITTLLVNLSSYAIHDDYMSLLFMIADNPSKQTSGILSSHFNNSQGAFPYFFKVINQILHEDPELIEKYSKNRNINNELIKQKELHHVKLLVERIKKFALDIEKLKALTTDIVQYADLPKEAFTEIPKLVNKINALLSNDAILRSNNATFKMLLKIPNRILEEFPGLIVESKFYELPLLIQDALTTQLYSPKYNDQIRVSASLFKIACRIIDYAEDNTSMQFRELVKGILYKLIDYSLRLGDFNLILKEYLDLAKKYGEKDIFYLSKITQFEQKFSESLQISNKKEELLNIDKKNDEITHEAQYCKPKKIKSNKDFDKIDNSIINSSKPFEQKIKYIKQPDGAEYHLGTNLFYNQAKHKYIGFHPAIQKELKEQYKNYNIDFSNIATSKYNLVQVEKFAFKARVLPTKDAARLCNKYIEKLTINNKEEQIVIFDTRIMKHDKDENDKLFVKASSHIFDGQFQLLSIEEEKKEAKKLVDYGFIEADENALEFFNEFTKELGDCKDFN